jgi:hypothetical protein
MEIRYWVVDIDEKCRKNCSILHEFSIQFSQVSKDFKKLEVDFVEMGFCGYFTYLLTTGALYFFFLCVCPLN